MPFHSLDAIVIGCDFKFQVRQEIAPIVLTVISCLVPILQHAEVVVLSLFFVYSCICIVEHLSSLIAFLDPEQELNKSLIENSAITLGRLAWVCPDLVSPHMEHFMQSWCGALSM